MRAADKKAQAASGLDAAAWAAKKKVRLVKAPTCCCALQSKRWDIAPVFLYAHLLHLLLYSSPRPLLFLGAIVPSVCRRLTRPPSPLPPR